MNAVKCPTCGKLLEGPITAQRWFPFCCEKCKLIDLGAWLDGSYVIPAVEPVDAESEEL
jgi:hypothetical protein